jgi:hypothetical protein
VNATRRYREAARRGNAASRDDIESECLGATERLRRAQRGDGIGPTKDRQRQRAIGRFIAWRDGDEVWVMTLAPDMVLTPVTVCAAAVITNSAAPLVSGIVIVAVALCAALVMVVVVLPVLSVAVMAILPLLAVVGKISTVPAVPEAPASKLVTTTVRKALASLLLSTTTALLAATVPAVTPSRVTISATETVVTATPEMRAII